MTTPEQCKAEVERAARDHANVVLFKLLFAAFQRYVTGEDLRQRALAEIARSGMPETDDAGVLFNTAMRDYAERVFGRA